jgi:hypothetical protein
VSGAPRPTHEEKQAVVRHGDGEAVSKIEEGAARLTGGRKKDYWAAVEIGCILKYRGGKGEGVRMVWSSRSDQHSRSAWTTPWRPMHAWEVRHRGLDECGWHASGRALVGRWPCRHPPCPSGASEAPWHWPTGHATAGIVAQQGVGEATSKGALKQW